MLRPWKILSADLLLSARPWVEVYRETVELPSGRVIDDYYRVVLADFAAVVAVTEQDQFVLVRGYRHGLRRVALTVPAGQVHAGETPLEAARRELREETGYEAAEWSSLGRFVVDGTRQCATMHAFLAHRARCVGTQRYDETEELEVELLGRSAALDALRRGEFEHLGTASAIALAVLEESRRERA